MAYLKYYQKQATSKQLEMLKDLYRVLGSEFDFAYIGKKRRYTAKEASKLIFLNKDIGFGIIEGGQCTIPQYQILTKLAGRKPKLERYLIGHSQAAEWIIKVYSKGQVHFNQSNKGVLVNTTFKYSTKKWINEILDINLNDILSDEQQQELLDNEPPCEYMGNDGALYTYDLGDEKELKEESGNGNLVSLNCCECGENLLCHQNTKLCISCDKIFNSINDNDGEIFD